EGDDDLSADDFRIDGRDGGGVLGGDAAEGAEVFADRVGEGGYLFHRRDEGKDALERAAVDRRGRRRLGGRSVVGPDDGVAAIGAVEDQTGARGRRLRELLHARLPRLERVDGGGAVGEDCGHFGVVVAEHHFVARKFVAEVAQPDDLVADADWIVVVISWHRNAPCFEFSC